MKGRYYVTPLITLEALNPLFRGEIAPNKLSSALSLRQREVLQLVAEGRTVKEIARVLNVSTKTVEYHKSVLMNRLDIHTTVELTQYAIGHGMVAV